LRVIVQKFGGTSVSTPERREQAVGHIARAVAEGYAVVVVVSALGRHGEPYATDTLLSLVDGKRNTLSPREIDLLLSCGEIISAVLTVEALARRGFPAIALTGAQAGVVTDDRFGDARILEVKPERVLSHLRNGEVCVVTGFQGVTREGEVTT
jgi:aspartate kinase